MSNQLSLTNIQDAIFNHIYLCLRINCVNIRNIKEKDYITIWEDDLNVDNTKLMGNNLNDNEEFEIQPSLNAFMKMMDFVNDCVGDVWNRIVDCEDGFTDIKATYKRLIIYYAFYWIVDMGYWEFKRQCEKRFG